MEYLILNKINNNILISEKVFSDLIKILPKKIDGIKINKIKWINLVRNGKNVEMCFEYLLAKDAKIQKKIIEMKTCLENSITQLIDLKPYNINMIFVGRY